MFSTIFATILTATPPLIFFAYLMAMHSSAESLFHLIEKPREGAPKYIGYTLMAALIFSVFSIPILGGDFFAQSLIKHLENEFYIDSSTESIIRMLYATPMSWAAISLFMIQQKYAEKILINKSNLSKLMAKEKQLEFIMNEITAKTQNKDYIESIQNKLQEIYRNQLRE